MRSYIPVEERINHAEFTPRALIDMGGMGAIIDVEESQTGRPVALKVMHPDVMAVEEARERFYLEAKVMARLEHPNIVPLHVLKLDQEGRPFYTMKKVVGQTLQQIISRLRRGDDETISEFPLDRLITVFYKVCDAIAFAHSKGVVHRDLKPANIMVGEFGEVLVMDWGLAKVLGEKEKEVSRLGLELEKTELQDDLEAGAMTISAAAGALTREGAVMGTPQYMAPEQATGRIADIDERSDVFALGGILYAILTLHPPFHGKDVKAILSKVVRGEVKPIRTFDNPDSVMRAFPMTRSDFELVHCPSGNIPSGLTAVAMRAMSPPSDKRYQTVSALQADIELWRTGYPTSAEKATLARQLGLLVCRNVIPSLCVLTVIVLAIWFGIKVDRSRQTMDAALAEVRQNVPMYEAEAKALVGQQKFQKAIDTYDQCLILIDEAMLRKRAEYHAQQGNLYQALNRYPESIAAYDASLELRSSQEDVSESRELSVELNGIPASDATKLRPTLSRLRNLLERQSRIAELNALLLRQRELEGMAEAELGDVLQNMLAQGAPDSVKNRLTRRGARLSLNLSGMELTDLSFIRGTGIKELDLSRTRFSGNLDLQDLKLFKLNLDWVEIEDLSALKGQRLAELHVANTGIKSIAQLSVNNLKVLDISNTAVDNLAPLENANLVELNVSRCDRLQSLAPAFRKSTLRRLYASQTEALQFDQLRAGGLKLEVLDGSANSQVSRIDDLRDMPLKELILSATRVENIAGLTGLPLVKLHLSGCPVADLSPLASLGKLEELRLRSMAIQDLSPLAKLPLKELDITGSVYVTDLDPLADCLQLERLAFSPPVKKIKINLSRIRNLPHLEKITKDFDSVGSDWSRLGPRTKREFWAWYDSSTWGKVFNAK